MTFLLMSSFFQRSIFFMDHSYGYIFFCNLYASASELVKMSKYCNQSWWQWQTQMSSLYLVTSQCLEYTKTWCQVYHSKWQELLYRKFNIRINTTIHNILHAYITQYTHNHTYINIWTCTICTPCPQQSRNCHTS